MDLSLLMNLPAEPQGIGLSGGADSTSLLLLLREHRPDVAVHVIHLDHQTRGQESENDAKFVIELADRLGISATIARRSEIELSLPHRPKNPSAFYRAMRLRLFAETARRQKLSEVLLAHHADDQAETVLHRLLRGSGVGGLTGMSSESVQHVGDAKLILRRPLLAVRRGELREYLTNRGQTWCEDASNQSERYSRNRLRKILTEEPSLSGALVELGRACTALSEWIDTNAARLDDTFRVEQLQNLPDLLSDAAARDYLGRQGVPREELTPAVVGRLVEMANDAASAPRQAFPGGVLLRRRGGVIGK